MTVIVTVVLKPTVTARVTQRFGEVTPTEIMDAEKVTNNFQPTVSIIFFRCFFRRQLDIIRVFCRLVLYDIF